MAYTKKSLLLLQQLQLQSILRCRFLCFAPAEVFFFGHYRLSQPFFLPQFVVQNYYKALAFTIKLAKCFIGQWYHCRVASVIGACPRMIPKPVYLDWCVVRCPYFHRCLRCLTKSFIPAFPGGHKALVVQNFLWRMKTRNAPCPIHLLSSRSFQNHPTLCLWNAKRQSSPLLLNYFLIHEWSKTFGQLGLFTCCNWSVAEFLQDLWKELKRRSSGHLSDDC